MRIIIEGPDGAGKSTLAKSLAGALDMNILKMTANGGQSAREYEQKLACDGVIIDRVREVWCCKHTTPHLKLDIEKFLTNISEIEHIATSSDEPKHDIAVYCFDNDIIIEVNDEDQS